MTKPSTYRLRLPTSFKMKAEKLAAFHTAAYFAERSGKGDPAAFQALLTRHGGQPPRAGDEMP